MTRQEVIDFLKSKGKTQDRFGHFVFNKVIPGLSTTLDGVTEPVARVYRYKVGPKALRYEVRVDYAGGGHAWVRLRSGFYGKLSVIGGKLHGMQR